MSGERRGVRPQPATGRGRRPAVMEPVLTRARLLGRPGVMTSRLNAAAMALEMFAVFFGTLGAVGLAVGSKGHLWGLGLGLTLWCLVVAGLARSPLGLVLGAVTQVMFIVVGTRVDLGWIVAVMFAALWAWLIWIGLKIDRDRSAWRQAESTQH